MIHCTAARCDIPENICESEQCRKFCNGCVAPTRRCVSCNAIGSIADAERGLCAPCAKKQPKPEEAPAEEDGEPEEKLNLPALLRRVKRPRMYAKSVRSKPMSKRMKEALMVQEETQSHTEHRDPARFNLLLEHAIERPDGSFRIPAAINTLSVREQIPCIEAEHVFARIAETQGLELDEAGAVILPATFAERVATVQARVSRHAYGQTDDLREAGTASAHDSVPSGESVRRTVESKTPSFAEAASLLIAHAAPHDNERVVRGCLPLLQHRLSIGARAARTIMEHFLKHEGVRQTDGWRVITVQEEALYMAARMQPAPSSANPACDEGLPFLRLIRSEDSAETVKRILTELDSLPNATDRQIEEIETLVRSLHDERDTLTQAITGIEERLTVLRASRAAAFAIRSFESEAVRALDACTDIISSLMDLLQNR